MSSNNHPNGAGIDWPASVRSGLQLAIIKVNEADYKNPFAQADYQQAEQAGVACLGLYDFGRPDLLSGSAEADLFLAGVGAIGGVRPGTRYGLDIEDHGGPGPQVDPHADLAAYCLDWASRVWPTQERQDTKLKPFLYSRRDYLYAHNLVSNVQLDATFDLWLVQDGAYPTPPIGWSKIWMTQTYGTLSGVTGPVDLDTFNGIAYDWLSKSWAYQTSPLNITTPTDVDPSLDTPSILRHVSGSLLSLHADVALLITRGGLIG